MPNRTKKRTGPLSQVGRASQKVRILTKHLIIDGEHRQDYNNLKRPNTKARTG